MKKKLIHLYLLIFISTLTLHAQFPSEGMQDKSIGRYCDDFTTTSSTAFSLERYENWEILGYAGLTTLFIFSSDMEMHEEYGLEKESGPLGITKTLGNVGFIEWTLDYMINQEHLQI